MGSGFYPTVPEALNPLSSKPSARNFFGGRRADTAHLRGIGDFGRGLGTLLWQLNGSRVKGLGFVWTIDPYLLFTGFFKESRTRNPN